jgi:hypothetical protein
MSFTPTNPFKKKLILSESDHYGVGLLLKEPGEQVICEFDKTEDMIFHAEFIKHAVNSYDDLNRELIVQRAKLAKAMRMQEIIADIGFYVGHRWRTLHIDICQKILEPIEGTRGLMDLIVQWASEFDAFWEELPQDDDRRENYIEVVDDFAAKRLDKLIEEAV